MKWLLAVALVTPLPGSPLPHPELSDALHPFERRHSDPVTVTNLGEVDVTVAGFPPAVERWRWLVAQYPAWNVDDALAVMACESGGNPDAVGWAADERGLFQIHPATWESTYGPRELWHDAGWNIAVAHDIYTANPVPWGWWTCQP